MARGSGCIVAPSSRKDAMDRGKRMKALLFVDVLTGMMGDLSSLSVASTSSESTSSSSTASSAHSDIDAPGMIRRSLHGSLDVNKLMDLGVELQTTADEIFAQVGDRHDVHTQLNGGILEVQYKRENHGISRKDVISHDPKTGRRSSHVYRETYDASGIDVNLGQSPALRAMLKVVDPKIYEDFMRSTPDASMNMRATNRDFPRLMGKLAKNVKFVTPSSEEIAQLGDASSFIRNLLSAELGQGYLSFLPTLTAQNPNDAQAVVNDLNSVLGLLGEFTLKQMLTHATHHLPAYGSAELDLARILYKEYAEMSLTEDEKKWVDGDKLMEEIANRVQNTPLDREYETPAQFMKKVGVTLAAPARQEALLKGVKDTCASSKIPAMQKLGPVVELPDFALDALLAHTAPLTNDAKVENLTNLLRDALAAVPVDEPGKKIDPVFRDFINEVGDAIGKSPDHDEAGKNIGDAVRAVAKGKDANYDNIADALNASDRDTQMKLMNDLCNGNFLNTLANHVLSDSDVPLCDVEDISKIPKHNEATALMKKMNVRNPCAAFLAKPDGFRLECAATVEEKLKVEFSDGIGSMWYNFLVGGRPLPDKRSIDEYDVAKRANKSRFKRIPDELKAPVMGLFVEMSKRNAYPQEFARLANAVYVLGSEPRDLLTLRLVNPDGSIRDDYENNEKIGVVQNIDPTDTSVTVLTEWKGHIVNRTDRESALRSARDTVVRLLFDMEHTDNPMQNIDEIEERTGLTPPENYVPNVLSFQNH